MPLTFNFLQFAPLHPPFIFQLGILNPQNSHWFSFRLEDQNMYQLHFFSCFLIESVVFHSELKSWDKVFQWIPNNKIPGSFLGQHFEIISEKREIPSPTKKITNFVGFFLKTQERLSQTTENYISIILVLSGVSKLLWNARLKLFHSLYYIQMSRNYAYFSTLGFQFSINKASIEGINVFLGAS